MLVRLPGLEYQPRARNLMQHQVGPALKSSNYDLFFGGSGYS
jgi:hypothetical protein